MTLVIIVVLVALAFEYVNGFHDTAISIATSVSTKVLSPRQAVILAATCNLAGAMIGTSVAVTIGSGIIDTNPKIVNIHTIGSALLAAVIWNLLTWWLGLPSSSSHALIGGLCGAALASSGGDWGVIHWDPPGEHMGGLWHKVIIPMFVSPVLGMLVGALVMVLLVICLKKRTPQFVNRVFGRLQLGSAAWMGVSHGLNDAQKTMGVIALLLYIGTQRGAFDGVPEWLAFLRTPEVRVAFWVKLVCALTMAAGTAAGGWRIIRTLGHQMVRLQPIHGFAAQTTAATIITIASGMGMPLSTTQVISSSILGVGATKRMSAVKWGVVGKIVWAWTLTLPTTAFVAYWLMRLCRAGGA